LDGQFLRAHISWEVNISITCEVIETIQSNDKVTTSSHHEGVEANDKKQSTLIKKQFGQ
jgi:hypothetical protein